MNILLFLDVFREKNQLEVLCLYPLRNFSMHITFNKGSANTGYSVLAPLSRAGFLNQSLVICGMQERHCRPLVAVFLIADSFDGPRLTVESANKTFSVT